jgi:hypothetical protein
MKTTPMKPRPRIDTDDAYGSEWRRIEERRKTLGLQPVSAGKDTAWGLALSGGGIRSATFSLGVLQALARASPAELTQRIARQGSKPAIDPPCLLGLFDYLSTVSGGGYIGSFFCSLFVPGRLFAEKPLQATGNQQEDKERRKQISVGAAANAYRALRYEPPGRIRSSELYDDRNDVGKGPLAWLRENGRYLTPTGGGDLLYGIALAIRNWCAVHYVLGTILLLAIALIAFGRCLFAFWGPWGDLEEWLLERTLLEVDPAWIWWSTLWLLPAVLAIVVLIPLGIAFWLTHPPPGKTEQEPPRVLRVAPIADLVLSAFMAAVAWSAWRMLEDEWTKVALSLAVVAAMAALGFVAFVFTRRGIQTIAGHRVVLTRLLASTLQWVLMLSGLALIDTLGQTLYRYAQEDWSTAFKPATVTGALMWLIQRLAKAVDEKKKPDWLTKIPLQLLAGVAGVCLFLVVAMFWALLVQWVQWAGLPPDPSFLYGETKCAVLGGLVAVAALLAITSGQFPGFINLSTLQALYGARLTRAYLGASNGERFKSGTEGAKVRSVAEPVASDQLGHDTYYAPGVLAPLHIVNVTMNQTTDRAEQLVQRDRKGKPLAILPQGFSIDGNHYEFASGPTTTEVGATLSMGQWIGTSGAAFSTGLGRATSLGTSLLLGLANVRLGRWWASGCGDDKSRGFERWFGKVFKTQAFLYSEFLAQFNGLRREWQYLSDGGHFENTAVYELLRPERKLELIVVCDCGCDRPYQFEDLANLIRLARIDFGIEVVVDTGVMADPKLQQVFGLPSEVADRSAKNDKCAIMLNVYDTRPVRGAEPRCRIVLVKPKLIESLPVDVKQYADTHEAFPQEPTSDQFFDEAQWESYRKLGFEIGCRIFAGETGDAVWRYLQSGATPS